MPPNEYLDENVQDDLQDNEINNETEVDNENLADDAAANNAQVVQGDENNAIYSAARQKAEADATVKIKAENQRFIQENLAWITNPATGKPFESIEELGALKKSVAEQQAAENLGVTKEQYADIAVQIKEDIFKNDPHIQNIMQTSEELRAEKNESVYAQVLQKVKASYPDEKATHIKELGEQFLSICANGVDPVVAYEAIRNNDKKKAQTPSMGDILQSGGAPKEFFTKDEIDKMSDAELEKNYDKIRTSINKWK